MFQRTLYDQLLAWRRDGAGKALLLYGPRQVGKSFLVRTLAQREYQSYVEINLTDNAQARKALAQASDVRDLISRISLFSSMELVPGNSLVFIDEIQELPNIMTMAKFLVEDGRFDYTFSGSMLGTEFKGVRSYPVGFVREFLMRPMSFEEFCWATGIRSEHLDMVREALRAQRPVPDYLHDALLSRFRTYMVVGGMPEVVQRYVDNGGDLGPARTLQVDLNTQYQHDIAKYAEGRALAVRSIFDRIPLQLAEKSLRFKVAAVDRGARYESYEDNFLWLVNAGVGLKVDQVSEPKPPLRRTDRPSLFKLYQSDVGMLVARYPQSVARLIYLDERSANLGGIYENVVAQELAAQDLDLYYYMARKRGEVDFITEGGEAPLPIEVKSGRSFRTHASLDVLLASEEYGIPLGIVLSRSNVMREGKVLYLPIYAAGMVRELYCADTPLPRMDLGEIG